MQIGSANDWKAIVGGKRYTLALKNDGTLYAWGLNDYGQLGIGNTNNQNTPQQVGSNSNWQAITAGGGHSLALAKDGTLYAWGANKFGQLGDRTNADKDVPTKIGSDTWKAIYAGGEHTLGIKSDGTLYAWGANTFGQLGDRTNADKNVPTKIGSDTWKAISAGGTHTLGIKSDGTLYAWGYNSYGQLGNGEEATGIRDYSKNKSTPVRIGTDTNWQEIAAGYQHSLARKRNGELYTWGLNLSNQLGLNRAVRTQTTPQQVGTQTNWQLIASVYNHSLALKSDGRLYAWGLNENGQLGDGTTANKTLISRPVLARP